MGVRENQLKEINQKLKESKERYSNLINNISDMIGEASLEGKITYVSPQVYDIMGYQPSELIGKNSFNYIHPEDTLIIAEAMKSALETKQMISIP